MTILKVHDLQQELTLDFVQFVKSNLAGGKSFEENRETIYLHGQEMGFCNEQIGALLEEIITK